MWFRGTDILGTKKLLQQNRAITKWRWWKIHNDARKTDSREVLLKGVPICKEAENSPCMSSGCLHASQFFAQDKSSTCKAQGQSGVLKESQRLFVSANI